MNERYVCTECGCHCGGKTILTAPNPFDNSEQIYGCPQCYSVNFLRGTCDEPDCWEPDTIGMPTPNGYRRTCYRHSVTDIQSKEDSK